jgi:DNA-binding MarR family transcriptional regulator
VQTLCCRSPRSVNVVAWGLCGGYAKRVKQHAAPQTPPETAGYRLDDQIGYVLRRATQRHLAIFSEVIPEVTTTQFAVLARLAEMGAQSQNHLGRATAMDGATIKGVVDRLVRLGLVETAPDTRDRRRLTVGLSAAGRSLFAARVGDAQDISDRTVAPLNPAERAQLLELLSRLT